MPWKSTPAITRILARTKEDPETGCLLYQPADPDRPLADNRAMYVKVNGKTLSVLRIVWEHANGPLPAYRNVIHDWKKCQNKRCINPKHLRLTGD